MKFKRGQIVFAKRNAPYAITTNGWCGTVQGYTDSDGNGNAVMEVQDISAVRGCFIVDPKYFDVVPYDNFSIADATHQRITIFVENHQIIARMFDKNDLVGERIMKVAPYGDIDFEESAKTVLDEMFAPAPPQTLLNMKFVITENDSKQFTIGRIYTVEKGMLVDDYNEVIPYEGVLREEEDLRVLLNSIGVSYVRVCE